ncbi:MAG: DNA-protecting protein DprA [Fimbriimonadaceae bacterium]|nr:DNA-protecting protein DprA [Fimbriimonadaceae bacterium]
MKTLLIAALTSHLVADAPPLSAKVWRALEPLVEAGEPVEALLEYANTHLGEPEDGPVSVRLGNATAYADALEVLAEQGVTALIRSDADYPIRLVDRLGPKAPPLLFAGGSLSLLRGDGVGIVGSRDVDEGGSDFAAQVARTVAARGASVISGGARGVDSVAMRAALEAGGSVVAYMADSMGKGLRSPTMRDALEEGRLCLTSPFSPSAGFSVGNAMGRNKLIYAHGLATVVVASAEGEGGTWAGAIEAVQLGLTPVLVREADEVPPGNRALLRKGCHGLREAEDLWAAIERHRPEQASLFE